MIATLSKHRPQASFSCTPINNFKMLKTFFVSLLQFWKITRGRRLESQPQEDFFYLSKYYLGICTDELREF